MQCRNCPRGRRDCLPLQNVVSDEEFNGAPTSFVCVGYNHLSTRVIPGDRFTVCWKNRVTDERGHWDKRDLLDTISVMSTALSMDENIRIGHGLTDDKMNAANLLADLEEEES